jgi:hypothetical protein
MAFVVGVRQVGLHVIPHAADRSDEDIPRLEKQIHRRGQEEDNGHHDNKGDEESGHLISRFCLISKNASYEEKYKC